MAKIELPIDIQPIGEWLDTKLNDLASTDEQIDFLKGVIFSMEEYSFEEAEQHKKQLDDVIVRMKVNDERIEKIMGMMGQVL